LLAGLTSCGSFYQSDSRKLFAVNENENDRRVELGTACFT
jgi:hypothetical protein